MTNANDPVTLLSKREYFAAMALQGMLLASADLETPENGLAGYAEDAVFAANALIEALNK